MFAQSILGHIVQFRASANLELPCEEGNARQVGDTGASVAVLASVTLVRLARIYE